MSDDAELSAALVDVRKAYRLIWSYQKRVFDMVNLIVGEFEDMSFYRWVSNHSGRACGPGTDPTNRWCWDMLPMYSTSYLYLSSDADRNTIKKGDWMLEIRVVSDDKFEDPDGGAEPDPADFENSEGAQSKIFLYARTCSEDVELNWFWNIWNKLEWPDENAPECTSYDDLPVKGFGRAFDIAALPDKESVQAAVESFRSEAVEKLGFPLR